LNLHLVATEAGSEGGWNAGDRAR